MALELYEDARIEGGSVQNVPRPDRWKYRKYDYFYHNPNGLFEALRQGTAYERLSLRDYIQADEILRSTTKALRNPVHRVVEFYATTMLSGTAEEAFPLREVEDPVRDAILRVWGWSNLNQLKQRIKRLTALHGFVFLKVTLEQDEGRVSFQEIKAENVSDYSKDPRGHIDYIRLDTPVKPDLEERLDGTRVALEKTVTEIWRKGTKRRTGGQVVKKPGYYKKWTRERDASDNSVVAEKKLGEPEEAWVLSESRGPRSLGFDFVPFVDIVAADSTDKWPCPVFDHGLPLIEEACKMATRYSELLFLYNKPHRAVEGIGNDPSGRPYPAPEVPGTDGPVIPDQDQVMFMNRMATLLQQTKPDETLNGDIWFGAPGNAQISDITPNIDFEAQRRALEDIVAEMRREMPELIYYETETTIPDSSRAVRFLMRAAVERSKEMRSNIENALIKADKMGLTMAQLIGAEGFDAGSIGTYEDGEGFDHSFEETEVVETADIEKQEVLGRQIANMIALRQLGYDQQQAAEQVGLSELAFAENAPTQPELDPMAMSVGTGGNPAGGTNLEGAARRVQQGFGQPPAQPPPGQGLRR